ECRLIQVRVDAMAVKMDDVVWSACFLRVPQLLLQSFERRRTKCLDVEPGAIRAKILQQRVCDSPELDVPWPPGTAHDVKQAHATIRSRRDWDERDIRVRLNPTERLYTHGERRIRLRIAHPLPRERASPVY